MLGMVIGLYLKRSGGIICRAGVVRGKGKMIGRAMGGNRGGKRGGRKRWG